MKKQLLILSMIALAGNAWANGDLHWQLGNPNPNAYYAYPWMGYDYDTTVMEVEKPHLPGTLFESINWYQAQDNLNAGSSIEYNPHYMGLVWWDFIGGHHILQSHWDANGQSVWKVNEPLPLQMNYIELTQGYPNPSVDIWFKVTSLDRRDGWTQLQASDPHVGGWVTHVNFFTASVPDTGSTLCLMLGSLASLAVLRRKI